MTTIAELEDPLLEPVSATGDEFVEDLRRKLRESWETIRGASRAIRSKQVERMNVHRVSVHSTRDIVPDSWVMLKHGSDDQARLSRKHGYPSFRKYKVKAVWHDKRKIEIHVPNGDTTLPEQSIRRVIPVPANWWISDDSSEVAGKIKGVATTVMAARGEKLKSGGKLPDEYQDDGDDFYLVEGILAARPVIQKAGNLRKFGRRWEYLVYYTGYPDLEWWQSQDTLSDASDDVRRAMQLARERYVQINGAHDGHNWSDVDESAGQAEQDEDDLQDDNDNVDNDANNDGDPTTGAYWEQFRRAPPRNREQAIAAQRLAVSASNRARNFRVQQAMQALFSEDF